MEQNHNLAFVEVAFLTDLAPYRRLVGRLIYLFVTRLDLAYSVHILSQFMQQPREDHWEAALKVVRYLKKSLGQGILLRTDSDISLEGWCDSDWASFHLRAFLDRMVRVTWLFSCVVEDQEATNNV